MVENDELFWLYELRAASHIVSTVRKQKMDLKQKKVGLGLFQTVRLYFPNNVTNKN